MQIKRKMKKIYRLFGLLLALIMLAGCSNTKMAERASPDDSISGANMVATLDFTDSGGVQSEEIDVYGEYYSKDEVAAYIHLYGKLPSNYITKKEARALGWTGGSLEKYAPGKCIGGDRYGNYEGVLPDEGDIKYYECDIDTLGKKKRGKKRIVYSDDGSIYYTEDHYNTFTQLY